MLRASHNSPLVWLTAVLLLAAGFVAPLGMAADLAPATAGEAATPVLAAASGWLPLFIRTDHDTRGPLAHVELLGMLWSFAASAALLSILFGLECFGRPHARTNRPASLHLRI